MSFLMKFMPSCKEVAEMLTKSEIQRIPLRKRVFLRMHLSMCSVCKRLDDQLAFISKELKETWLFKAKLSEASKDRIQQVILKKIKNNCKDS